MVLLRTESGNNHSFQSLPWPQMDMVVAQILEEYGDIVDLKSKTLLKFGGTANADSGVKTTVATFGSVGTPNVNETYSTTNDIDAVVSSDDGDTETLLIEGHTLDSSGNKTFVTQEVTLTGQTPAALTTALGRCTRMKVKDGTFASPSSDLAGDIYAYASDGVTVTAGVPQTNTAVKARIVAGRNQTEKAATALSSEDYYAITQFQASVSRGNASTVTADVELEQAALGGVFLPKGLELSVRAGGDQGEPIRFDPYLIVPKNADIRMVATTNTNDASVTGYFAGYLLRVRP